MWSTLLDQLKRHRTTVVTGMVIVAILVGVLVIPRGDDSPQGLVDVPEELQDDAEVGEETIPAERERSRRAGGEQDASPTSTGPAVGVVSPVPETTASGGGRSLPIGRTRGVSGGKIKIGVALPDLSAFAQISEDFDVGDTREQFEAILDGWRRRGIVPVHGRDVEFVYREFDIFSTDEKIAACRELIEDEKVFTIIAGRFFGEGSECVADRFDTPMLTLNSDMKSLYDRLGANFFTIRPTWERLFRNWMHWADTGGHLKDRTIGLFYEEEVEPAVVVGIKRELDKRGYEIEEEVAASGAGVGTSQDQSAVLRFQGAGVDLAIMVTGGTSMASFMNFAESQGYNPTYIATDYGEHTTDAATSLYPSNQYDGTFGMTATRVGEVRAGKKLPPETRVCVNNYERFSGKEVGPSSPETAEYNNVLVGCDMANTMLSGILLAGRGLGHLSLIRGLEAIGDLPLAAHQKLSFAPNRHFGVDTQRTAHWSQNCRCWEAMGKFRPFWL